MGVPIAANSSSLIKAMNDRWCGTWIGPGFVLVDAVGLDRDERDAAGYRPDQLPDLQRPTAAVPDSRERATDGILRCL